ncbi:type I polyketide synthase, partial [Streptomyces sp. M2CJ-2]|uniref:polyketide synthase dehydratase domain-containing protein n=1 Tax=Streptomyces sp. M2CJ-2 TaxID=2803948 RepID=UPI0019260ED8
VIAGAGAEVEPVVERLTAGGVRTRRLRVSHAFHSPLMEPMLDAFAHVLAGLEFQAPTRGLISMLGGAQAAEMATPGYWVRHAREAVRFADGVRAFADAGVARLVELGPDTVLTALATEALGERAEEFALVPLLRRDGDEATTAVHALAALHVGGAPVDWEAFYAGTGAKRVELPTYPFQHERYWISSTSGTPGQAAKQAGLASAEHGLLGSVLPLPESGGAVLTGRLSVDGQPWLADHRVHGAVVVPGTALVEMAIRAGDEVGCARLEELTLHAPLVLPDAGGVAVQIAVDGPDDEGRRTLTIHARDETAEAGDGWVRHATGALSDAVSPVPADSVAAWPPTGAEPVDVAGVYDDTLPDLGFAYGPAFRGLRGVWRRGEELFAEVATAEEAGIDPKPFGLHPALLDAALHAQLVAGDGDAVVPFAWSGVEVFASGASLLRVRMAPADGEGVSLDVADGEGRLVASVASLVARPLGELGEGAAPGAGELFGVEWAEWTGSSSGAGGSAVVVGGAL